MPNFKPNYKLKKLKKSIFNQFQFFEQGKGVTGSEPVG